MLRDRQEGLGLPWVSGRLPLGSDGSLEPSDGEGDRYSNQKPRDKEP